MIVVVVIGGDVYVRNVILKYLELILVKFIEMGVIVEEGDDCVRVIVDKFLKVVNIKIILYLGFLIDV